MSHIVFLANYNVIHELVNLWHNHSFVILLLLVVRKQLKLVFRLFCRFAPASFPASILDRHFAELVWPRIDAVLHSCIRSVMRIVALFAFGRLLDIAIKIVIRPSIHATGLSSAGKDLSLASPIRFLYISYHSLLGSVVSVGVYHSINSFKVVLLQLGLR